MSRARSDREEELRSLLTDAIEVQLAAFKAGIRFWEAWIGEASAFVRSATEKLRTLGESGSVPKDALLEVVDAGRDSIRSMMELPRSTATFFIEELDQVARRPAGPPAAGKKRPARKRAARVKP
jgi:hypothetical protein